MSISSSKSNGDRVPSDGTCFFHAVLLHPLNSSTSRAFKDFAQRYRNSDKAGRKKIVGELYFKTMLRVLVRADRSSNSNSFMNQFINRVGTTTKSDAMRKYREMIKNVRRRVDNGQNICYSHYVDSLEIAQFADDMGITIAIYFISNSGEQHPNPIIFGPQNKKKNTPNVFLRLQGYHYTIHKTLSVPKTSSNSKQKKRVRNNNSNSMRSNTSKINNTNANLLLRLGMNKNEANAMNGLLNLSNHQAQKLALTKVLMQTMLARIPKQAFHDKTALWFETVSDIMRQRVSQVQMDTELYNLKMQEKMPRSNGEYMRVTVNIQQKSNTKNKTSMILHIKPVVERSSLSKVELLRFTLPFVNLRHGIVYLKGLKNMLSSRYSLKAMEYQWQFRIKPSEPCAKFIDAIFNVVGMKKPMEVVRLHTTRKFFPQNIQDKLRKGTISAEDQMHLYESLMYNTQDPEISENGTQIKFPWKDKFVSLKSQEAQAYLRNVLSFIPPSTEWNQRVKRTVDALFDAKEKGEDNMFFISGHGSTLSSTFTMPPNVYLFTTTPPAALGFGPIGVKDGTLASVAGIKSFVYGTKSYRKRNYAVLYQPGDQLQDISLSWMDEGKRTSQQKRGVWRLPLKFKDEANMYWKANQTEYSNEFGFVKVNKRSELNSLKTTLSQIIEKIRSEASQDRPILIITNPCRGTKNNEAAKACIEQDFECRKRVFGCIVPTKAPKSSVMRCASVGIHGCFWNADLQKQGGGGLMQELKRKKIRYN